MKLKDNFYENVANRNMVNNYLLSKEESPPLTHNGCVDSKHDWSGSMNILSFAQILNSI